MNSLTKKFKSGFSDYEVEIEKEYIEVKAIAFHEGDGDLAYLVDNNDERAAFNNIEVARADGKILIAFTEPTEFIMDDVILGAFED